MKRIAIYILMALALVSCCQHDVQNLEHREKELEQRVDHYNDMIATYNEMMLIGAQARSEWIVKENKRRMDQAETEDELYQIAAESKAAVRNLTKDTQAVLLPPISMHDLDGK